MTNKKLRDVRYITLRIEPFRHVQRLEDTLQVRFVRLGYDMLQMKVTAEIQGVAVGRYRLGTKLRTVTLDEPESQPDWIKTLINQYMPPDYFRAQRQTVERTERDLARKAARGAAGGAHEAPAVAGARSRVNGSSR